MPSSKKSIVASVTADLLIAAVKGVGAVSTGSVVMLAEAIHSLLDGGSASLLLLGERLGKRPATRRHPFGHGKEVYFWSSVVAMLAFVVGGGFAALEGALSLREREHRRIWINLVVLAAAFVFNGVSLWIALRELRRYQRVKRYPGGIFAVMRASHNPAMWVAVLTDLAAVAGILIAAAGIASSALLHSPVPDALASMLDGALIMAVGVLLGLEARGLVVGEGARQGLLDDARRAIAADDAIDEVTDIRSLQLGPESVLLVVAARFAERVAAGDLPRVCHRVEERVRREHPSICEIVFAF